MQVDQRVTYAHLEELRHLRAVHHRAASWFTSVDTGVHSGRPGSRSSRTLISVRDALNDEAERAWWALKSYEQRHPEVVRVLDLLEAAEKKGARA